MPLEKDESGGSVRDALVAALEESKGKTAGSTSSAELKPQDAAAKDPKPTPSDPKSTAPDKAAVQAKEPVKDAAPAKEPVKDKDSKEAAKDSGEKPLEPPARWTKEEKEEFAALDPKIQRILLNRNKGLEADYTRKMQEIASERQRAAAIEQILAPRRSSWTGTDDIVALNGIMQYWDLAQRDPLQFITVFAQQRGIDLPSLFAPQYAQSQQQQLQQLLQQATQPTVGADGKAQAPVLHPAVAAQLEQLAQQQMLLQQRLQQTEAAHQQRAVAEHVSVVQQAAGQLASFEKATDEHGQPRYPFFQDVRADMARLMSSGMADTLEDAYEKATFLKPEVRSKIEENRRIAWRREEEARRAAEAERAKKAGLSVTASSVDPPPPAKDDDYDKLSLRDQIKRAWAESSRSARIG